MRPLRLLPLLPLIGAVLVAAGCGGGSKSVPTDAVAVVNGKIVAKAQFNQLLASAKSVDKAKNQPFPKPGTAEYKTLEDQIMSFLVQEEELEQKAKSLGITVTDKDVQQQLDRVKQQYFAGKQKAFEKGLAKQGLTLDVYKIDWRAQLLGQKVYTKVTKNVKVSDSEISDYYKLHKADYTVKESRDVRHILVNNKGLASKLETQLKDGASFASLARKYSKDPTSAKNGGVLAGGDVKGRFVKPFENVAFKLRTHQISRPVHSKFGWHIIEALGPVKPATPAKPTPLAQVKEAIRQTILQNKKTQAIQAWEKKMKDHYCSEIAYQAGYSPPPGQDPCKQSTTSTATTSTG
jgi:parvulin-like peptidyl-prolyl isomerase